MAPGGRTVTREQAWEKARVDALSHFQESSQMRQHGVTVTTEKMHQGLYAGLRIVRERLAVGTLRSNDLVQLVACALDCLGAAYYDAIARGEEPKRPSEVRGEDPTDV
jgi:hypothetical protein